MAALVAWVRWLADWQAPEDTTGRLLIAALGVTGVAVTACVALIGVALRHSIDRRTTQLGEIESARADTEQRRLRTETALRMVELIDATIDTEAGTARASAGVLMLARLGEIELAIDIVGELWPHNRVSASAAVGVIDDALASRLSTTSQAAASLLVSNVDKLDAGDHMYEWPETAHDAWPATLPQVTRVLLCVALGQWLARRPAISDSDFRVKLVREASSVDPDEQVRRIAKESSRH